MSIGSEGGFEEIVSDITQHDKDEVALRIAEDLLARIDTGEASGADESRTEDAVEELLGECNYPAYCKFYGENVSWCDRSCDLSIYDQI